MAEQLIIDSLWRDLKYHRIRSIDFRTNDITCSSRPRRISIFEVLRRFYYLPSTTRCPIHLMSILPQRLFSISKLLLQSVGLLRYRLPSLQQPLDPTYLWRSPPSSLPANISLTMSVHRRVPCGSISNDRIEPLRSPSRTQFIASSHGVSS